MTHECTRTASLATHDRAAVVEAARECGCLVCEAFLRDPASDVPTEQATLEGTRD